MPLNTPAAKQSVYRFCPHDAAKHWIHDCESRPSANALTRAVAKTRLNNEACPERSRLSSANREEEF